MTSLFTTIDILSRASSVEKMAEEHAVLFGFFISRKNWLGRVITYMGKYLSYFSEARDQIRIQAIVDRVQTIFSELEKINGSLNGNSDREMLLRTLSKDSKRVAGALFKKDFTIKIASISRNFFKREPVLLKDLLHETSHEIFSNLTGILKEETEQLFHLLSAENAYAVAQSESAQSWIDRVNRRAIEYLSPKMLMALLNSQEDRGPLLLWNLYQLGLKIGPKGAKWAEFPENFPQTEWDKALSTATKKFGVKWHTSALGETYIVSSQNMLVALWSVQQIECFEQCDFKPLIPILNPDGMSAKVEKPLYFLSASDLWEQPSAIEIISRVLDPSVWSNRGVPEKEALDHLCVLKNGEIATLIPKLADKHDFSWYAFEKLISSITKEEPSRITEIYNQLEINENHPDIAWIAAILKGGGTNLSKQDIWVYLHGSGAIHKTETFFKEVCALFDELDEASEGVDDCQRQRFRLDLFYFRLDDLLLFTNGQSQEVQKSIENWYL